MAVAADVCTAIGSRSTVQLRRAGVASTITTIEWYDFFATALPPVWCSATLFS